MPQPDGVEVLIDAVAVAVAVALENDPDVDALPPALSSSEVGSYEAGQNPRTKKL